MSDLLRIRHLSSQMIRYRFLFFPLQWDLPGIGHQIRITAYDLEVWTNLSQLWVLKGKEHLPVWKFPKFVRTNRLHQERLPPIIRRLVWMRHLQSRCLSNEKATCTRARPIKRRDRIFGFWLSNSREELKSELFAKWFTWFRQLSCRRVQGEMRAIDLIVGSHRFAGDNRSGLLLQIY